MRVNVKLIKKQKPRNDVLGWLGAFALFVTIVFILISDDKKEKSDK